MRLVPRESAVVILVRVAAFCPPIFGRHIHGRIGLRNVVEQYWNECALRRILYGASDGAPRSGNEEQVTVHNPRVTCDYVTDRSGWRPREGE